MYIYLVIGPDHSQFRTHLACCFANVATELSFLLTGSLKKLLKGSPSRNCTITFLKDLTSCQNPREMPLLIKKMTHHERPQRLETRYQQKNHYSSLTTYLHVCSRYFKVPPHLWFRLLCFLLVQFGRLQCTVITEDQGASASAKRPLHK